MPRKIKKAAEMEVPMIPPTRENESNREEMEDAVAATTIEVRMTILSGRKNNSAIRGLESWRCGRNTYVECPRLKNVPTVTGLCPEATSRLVIRSMSCKRFPLDVFTANENRGRTAMWSASRACRSPRVYDRAAVASRPLVDLGYSQRVSDLKDAAFYLRM